jgi:hypothetical protein
MRRGPGKPLSSTRSTPIRLVSRSSSRRHDWDLDQKRILVGKAYEALQDGGALIVYEAIIDDDRSQNAFGLLMSLNMLIETDGGFDYTAADCMGWMTDAGFTTTRAEHLIGPDSMVVGLK